MADPFCLFGCLVVWLFGCLVVVVDDVAVVDVVFLAVPFCCCCW